MADGMQQLLNSGTNWQQGSSNMMNGFHNDYWNPVDFLLPGYSMLNNMFDFTGANAANAQYQNQLALQQQAQAYNSAEADKSRQWQAMMSNSEVQRRMADIKAAGLNPWLALSQSMSGGSTPSGSSASSSAGSADMANNKLVMAAGLIATALRIFLAKH